MTTHMVDLATNSKRRKRPVIVEKRKRRLLLYLALIGVLFYICVISYFVGRHYLLKQAKPPQTNAAVPAERPPIIETAPVYPDLRQKHLDDAVQHAQFVQDIDPVFAGSKYDKAVAFANQVGISPSSAKQALAALPSPSSLNPVATLSLISIKREPPIIWVEASVVGPDGQFIRGLKRHDFHVEQSGRRIHWLVVGESVRHGRPSSLAVLVDTSGSTTGQPLPQAKAAIADFINHYGRHGRIKLWAFGSDVKPLTGWTTNNSELLTKLDSLRSNGGTALHRAIEEAVADLATLDGPRSLLLFTDGSDSTNHPLQPAVDQAKKSQVQIHIVALETGETKPEVLQRIASQTGGSFQMVNRADSLIQKFQAVIGQLTKPVYRVAITESLDPKKPLTLRVANLPPITVALPE